MRMQSVLFLYIGLSQFAPDLAFKSSFDGLQLSEKRRSYRVCCCDMPWRSMTRRTAQVDVLAAQAHTLGLMDAEGLQHVVLEAAQDLRRARARYAFDVVDWAKCVRQLNKDIRAANEFLPDNLQACIDTPLPLDRKISLM